MSLKDNLKMATGCCSQAEEAYLSIVVTSCRLTDFAAALHKEYGLTPTQYNILRILRGSQPETLSCTDIMERSIEKNPDITRLLDRLSDAGFITRIRCTEDRRMVKTGITKKGLDLLKKLDKTVAETHQPLAALTETELQTLIALLEKIRTAIPQLSKCSDK